MLYLYNNRLVVKRRLQSYIYLSELFVAIQKYIMMINLIFKRCLRDLNMILTFLSCLLQEMKIIVPALQFKKNNTVAIWFSMLNTVISEKNNTLC